MAHEICVEVLDFGPDCQRRFKPGQKVCALPMMLGPGWRRTVGYSNDYNGGYGEYMLLKEALLLLVPDNLTADLAVLTEPVAVGLHAVEMAQVAPGAVPLVIGCGPVGLAVIVALKMKGLGPVLAADFSAQRRELAIAMGADQVIDPAARSPYDNWRRWGRMSHSRHPHWDPYPRP